MPLAKYLTVTRALNHVRSLRRYFVFQIFGGPAVEAFVYVRPLPCVGKWPKTNQSVPIPGGGGEDVRKKKSQLSSPTLKLGARQFQTLVKASWSYFTTLFNVPALGHTVIPRYAPY